MDESPWLRLITIGLVLAALAVGYFLISGRFFVKSPRPEAPVERAVQQPTPTPQVSPSPTPTVTPSTQTSTLPRTGFPAMLIGIFSAAASVAGWGLRKFPH